MGYTTQLLMFREVEQPEEPIENIPPTVKVSCDNIGSDDNSYMCIAN
ncbi:MAG: hypothetical protein U9Q66_01225 [Patescibacteria group bacterium]|nr:hypothetical protein [Patescibacteria group bacterium]